MQRGLTFQKSPEIRHFWALSGVPYGTRTRVSAVKGRRPRPLDEGDCAVLNKLPKLERQRNQATVTKKIDIKQSLFKYISLWPFGTN